MRVAAIGDIHLDEHRRGTMQLLFSQISEQADVLVLAGDLTNHGTPAEAKVVVEELAGCQIPVVAVLGNHDYESNAADELRDILKSAHISLLDEESFIHGNIGFVGLKGFMGGFGRYILTPFGELDIKRFVQVTVDDALHLEGMLSNLETDRKIVVLHYAPIPDTVIGEPPEIFPFLGCSRLSHPIDNFQVDAVFHGHAHHGTPAAKTAAGVPVYNVAYPLMAKHFPDQPYRLVEV
ncbi:metallophosphoesterase family protein [Nitrosococcus wardiae]|uniref:Metallophosphoesterase n=1 Tax=Nitrosococcus wardiae TaxID=1814290 RepID=A0A4P7BXY4_9GAMM|nr:metallophosphoesterase [Nitrosococcus wardiae]QBQ54069.1 metallophosphoesterase [Nitrosococcus wardiae]